MELAFKGSVKDDDFDAFLMDTSDLGCNAQAEKSQSEKEQIACREQFLKARKQSALTEHLENLQKLESSIRIQKTIIEEIVQFQTYERETRLGQGKNNNYHLTNPIGQDEDRVKTDEHKEAFFSDNNLISDLGAKKRFNPQ